MKLKFIRNKIRLLIKGKEEEYFRTLLENDELLQRLSKNISRGFCQIMRRYRKIRS